MNNSQAAWSSSRSSGNPAAWPVKLGGAVTRVPRNSVPLEQRVWLRPAGMAARRAAGRFFKAAARDGVPGSGAGGQFVDLPWRVDAELAEDVVGWFGDLGALLERSGGAGERADVDAVEFAADGRPGLPGGVLCDADEQQREPRSSTWAASSQRRSTITA